MVWYTSKEGYPLSKFQIWFLALISVEERFGQELRDAHITINHILPLHPPRLTFQGSWALANTPGIATSMLGLIFTRLTEDLSQTKEHLPWRWQVDGTIPREAVLPRVNVPNHVRSRRLKNEGLLICSKLTGDLPHGEGNIPWRQQVHTSNPLEAVLPGVNVPITSGAAGWKMKFGWSGKTHRGPSQWWGQHSLMMAGQYLKPPWSSTAQSKCAKSCQGLPAEKWSLADLLETHRGPAPWWEQYPLKMAGQYLQPPWSSAAWSKCAKSLQELQAEKWRLADLLGGPAPWWGQHPLKTAGQYLQPPWSSSMEYCEWMARVRNF